MANPTLEEKVDNLLTEVTEIKIALKGYGDGTGLLKTFEQHCNQDREFRADYYKFKRVVLITIAFLVGSSGIGIAILKFF